MSTLLTTTITVKFSTKHGESREATIEQAPYESCDAFFVRVRAMHDQLKVARPGAIYDPSKEGVRG